MQRFSETHESPNLPPSSISPIVDDDDQFTDCIQILQNRDYEENGGSPARR